MHEENSKNNKIFYFAPKAHLIAFFFNLAFYFAEKYSFSQTCI